MQAMFSTMDAVASNHILMYSDSADVVNIWSIKILLIFIKK